jgi:hypothetical protein
MSELESSLLKLGQWPICRSRRIVSGRIGESGFLIQYLQNLFSVVFPVGRGMNITAGHQMFAQAVHQCGLDQTAFMVPGLGPGIGKEDMHALQSMRRAAYAAILRQHHVE